MWHAQVPDILKFIRNLGITQNDILEKFDSIKDFQKLIQQIIHTCPACKNSSTKLLPQPRCFGIVANAVNEWAVMDVTHVTCYPKGSSNLLATLHIMDVASRYSLFIPITTKRSIKCSDVVTSFLWWSNMFSRVPLNLLCDQGREFIGMEFVNFFNSHGGTNFWTPPYNSPSAGLIERHHFTCQVIWNRLLDDTYVEQSIKNKSLTYEALGLAVSLAKNSMTRRCGKSAQWLAFGNSIDFPNDVIESGPSSFSNVDSNNVLRRKAIEIANSSDLRVKLEKEMMAQRRIPAPLFAGQHVDFRIRNPIKNRGAEYWVPNCTIISREGHDRYIIKQPNNSLCEVHRRQLRLSIADEPIIGIPFNPADPPDVREHKLRQATDDLQLEYDIEPPTQDVLDEHIVEQNNELVEEPVINSVPDSEKSNDDSETERHIDDSAKANIDASDTPLSSGKTSLKPAKPDLGLPPGFQHDDPTPLPRRSARLAAKRQNVFVYSENFAGHVSIDPDTGKICPEDYIYLANSMGGIINLDHNPVFAMKPGNVKKWIRMRRKAANPLMQGSNKATRPLTKAETEKWKSEIDVAKQIELRAFDKLATFSSEPFSKTKHENAITFKWVYTKKPVDPKQLKGLQNDPLKCKILVENGASRVKARLVVRGFQEQVSLDTASPTCRRQMLAIALSWATVKNYEVLSGDTPNAFLRGKDLQRPVFIFPPPEHPDFSRGHIWSLTKCVYGLIDAPLRWFEAAKDMIQSCDGKYHSLDPATAYFPDASTGQVQGLVPWHVDDFIFTGSEKFFKEIFPRLKNTLSFPETENPKDPGGMRFTGAYIIRNQEGMTISQDIYVSGLTPIDTAAIKNMKHSELAPEHHQAAFRSSVASCAWATQRTALTEMFLVAKMASQAGKATIEDIFTINKVVRKLQHHPQRLLFPRFDMDFEKCRILVVCDSSHGPRAQGCFMCFITHDRCSTDSPQPAHLIQAKSWKLKRVAVSTFAAEAQALLEGFNIAKLVQELTMQFLNVRLPIDLRTDHMGLVSHLNSACAGLSCVRTELQIMSLKECLGEDIRTIKHVEGNHNLADVGTIYPSRVSDAVREVMRTGFIENLY